MHQNPEKRDGARHGAGSADLQVRLGVGSGMSRRLRSWSSALPETTLPVPCGRKKRMIGAIFGLLDLSARAAQHTPWRLQRKRL